MLDDFLSNKGVSLASYTTSSKQKSKERELTLIRREAESKSLWSGWISACSVSVFTVAIIFFPMRHPTLIKSGSWASELATRGDGRGTSLTRGRAKPSPVGASAAARSPCFWGFRVGEFPLEVFLWLVPGVCWVVAGLGGFFAFWVPSAALGLGDLVPSRRFCNTHFLQE
jgi:hypothetical protein